MSELTVSNTRPFPPAFDMSGSAFEYEGRVYEVSGAPIVISEEVEEAIIQRVVRPTLPFNPREHGNFRDMTLSDIEAAAEQGIAEVHGRMEEHGLKVVNYEIRVGGKPLLPEGAPANNIPLSYTEKFVGIYALADFVRTPVNQHETQLISEISILEQFGFNKDYIIEQQSKTLGRLIEYAESLEHGDVFYRDALKPVQWAPVIDGDELEYTLLDIDLNGYRVNDIHLAGSGAASINAVIDEIRDAAFNRDLVAA